MIDNFDDDSADKIQSLMMIIMMLMVMMLMMKMMVTMKMIMSKMVVVMIGEVNDNDKDD